MAMTNKSAAAMDDHNHAKDEEETYRAVAKKLTEPPMYEAQRHEAAMAASDGCNHNLGHVSQMTKERRHPTMDPKDPMPSGPPLGGHTEM